MFASVVALVLILVAAGPKHASPLELLGKLDAQQLPETSGIVKSRRFKDIFWVHNDSGNKPFLFAIRHDGKIVRRYRVEVPNIDWEDIAIDDRGHLYLGDIGNNDNRLPIRAIHQLDEPDPALPDDGPLKSIKSSFYNFPKKGRFDAEGLFIDGDRAILVAKTFDHREAELYAVPFDKPGTLLRPVFPSRIGTLNRFKEPATGADLSPDGRLLAVCSATVTRVYERGQQESWELVAEVAYPSCAIEAICWDGPDLILAGEDQKVSRIAEFAWRKQ